MSTSAALLDHPGTSSGLWADDEDECQQDSASVAPLEVVASASDEVAERADDEKLLFEELADELDAVMRGESSTRLAMRHPAYGEILALGDKAVPWLLKRLEVPGNRPLWLRLLGSLTHFQPGAGMETVPDAAAAWVRWGKLRNGQ
jgi:hypothetical protein